MGLRRRGPVRERTVDGGSGPLELAGEEPERELRARLDAGLRERARDVLPDGGDARAEGGRDLLVRQAEDEELRRRQLGARELVPSTELRHAGRRPASLSFGRCPGTRGLAGVAAR